MYHAGDAAAPGLRLDNFESVLNGSVRGPVVKAADLSGRELIRCLQGTRRSGWRLDDLEQSIGAHTRIDKWTRFLNF